MTKRANIALAMVRTALVGGGGYALSAVAVTCLAPLLAKTGLARVDATALAQMLGFVILLGLVLIGFAIRDVRKLLLPYLALPLLGWMLLTGLAG